MKKNVHIIYKMLGHCVCKFLGMYWNLRDKVMPPKEKTVLFVAHPDDDTLFFHTLIKNEKPYVCLMTSGWSLRRLPCFMKAMKYYGVRYRVFDLETKDQRENLIKDNVRKVLALGEFDVVVTHNSKGEYGHEMHRRLHECVMDIVKKPLLCPVMQDEICSYPLQKELVQEKKKIFNEIYYTEKFVLEQYSEWIAHEKLKQIGG